MAKGRKTGGRQKGVPNKATAGVKAAMLEAFKGIGGVPALTVWAKANPTEYYKLFARLIPTEVSGPDGGAVEHAVKVTFIDAA